MGEFDDFAAQARRDLDDKQRIVDEEQRARAASHDQLVAIQISALERDALPTVLEAKAAFERQGVKVEVNKNWERGTHLGNSQIVVAFTGQKKRPYDNSFYDLAGSRSVVINHDGTTLFIKIATNPYATSFDASFMGASQQDLREAIKLSAQKLFEELEPER